MAKLNISSSHYIGHGVSVHLEFDTYEQILFPLHVGLASL